VSKEAKRLRNRADKLWTQLIHDRGRGVCEARGWTDPVTGWTNDCSGGLQAAHFVRRNAGPLRCDLDNGAALCVMHHRHFDEHDQGAMRLFVDSQYGAGHYDDLRHRRQVELNGYYGVSFWRERVDALKQTAARRGLTVK